METTDDKQRMFECVRIPGRLTLSVGSCAKSWQDGNGSDPDKRMRFHHCTRCPQGAIHAGCATLAVVNPYYMRKRCPRCDRPSQRMIGGRICVSCYNRELEVLKGRDGRGKVPKNLPQVHAEAVAMVVNGRFACVQVAYAVDLLEAQLVVLRKTEGEVRFGFHPKPPIVGRGAVQLTLW